MKRRGLSRLARVRIWDAAGGVCHLCGIKIHAERGETWDADHIKPLWLGGGDTEANMAPAHKSCHREKTSTDAPVKAKSDRQRAKHLGIKKTKQKIPSRGFKSYPSNTRDINEDMR